MTTALALRPAQQTQQAPPAAAVRTKVTAVQMLQALGAERVRLLSNNPTRPTSSPHTMSR
jgi:GTP cyclohydrolase II